jgi:hypothetical protein
LFSPLPSACIRPRDRPPKDKHDGRNYWVDFEKIREGLGFTLQRTVVDGIQQGKAAIDRGEIEDDENPM